MTSLFLFLAGGLGLVILTSVGYLLVLLSAAFLAKRERRPSGTVLPDAASAPRMAVVIPAHNEELVLAATLASLASQDYPRERFEVVVVADNCTDATAAIARAHGAQVLERTNRAERGKGYALDWAIAHLLAAPAPADAFVIVDADTWTAPNFLTQMASPLVSDPDMHGRCALQGRYRVLNSEEGWRAALMGAAFDLCNHVKLLGQARLGLSVGLKGNGMAFTRAVLEGARWGGSITEDIDFGLELLRRHGVRVRYVPDALVRAQMPTGVQAASTQRERWEMGRYRLLRERAVPLFWEGLKQRNALLCDAGLSLMVPPLAELTALLMLWGGTVALGEWMHLLPGDWEWNGAFALAALGLLTYVVGGLAVADAPADAYRALLKAPGYTLWKLGRYAICGLKTLSSPKRESAEWVRTAREPMATTQEQPGAAE
jgi:cellulose synthase/poly-beta-1,6-N-acetylglucosamine synthase-like glycosyltransferase